MFSKVDCSSGRMYFDATIKNIQKKTSTRRCHPSSLPPLQPPTFTNRAKPQTFHLDCFGFRVPAFPQKVQFNLVPISIQ